MDVPKSTDNEKTVRGYRFMAIFTGLIICVLTAILKFLHETDSKEFYMDKHWQCRHLMNRYH